MSNLSPTLAEMDTTMIAPGLWMGGEPPMGRDAADCGFNLVVFCAEENQPNASAFPGVVILHAGIDDARLTILEMEIATAAAHRVALAVTRGQKVLVTCMQGRNRSGLVVALALHIMTKKSGDDCLWAVRRKRLNALTNPSFAAALRALKAAA